jgi:ABC-type sugar transport system permease subunit
MRKYLDKISEFFNKYVVKYLAKAKHFLTNNWVLTITYNHVIIAKRLKIKITNKRRAGVIGISFIFLWIVGYLIFSLYPVFNTLYLSFFKVTRTADGLGTAFEGINNYRAAFLSDPYFVEILLNYFIRMLLSVPVTIVFALIIAMLINQDIRAKGLWRTVFFLPVIIASGPVIGELMNQGATTLPSIEEYGFIDLIIANVGDFLANPIQALFDEILLILWFAGIQILILLAGLQKIDKSIYEAAMIDGASPWETFWKITLPSLMPLITVSVIYTVVSMSVFSLNDVSIYIRDKMQGESTPAITTGYGYSSSLSWIYFLAMVIIILLFVGALNLRRKRAR